MKKVLQIILAGITIIVLSGSSHLLAQDLTPRAQPSLDRNYIHTLIPQTSSDDDSAMIESIQYFDGLGRPSQAVFWQASPAGKDIVTPVHYDSFGRESRKYLPYAITGASIGAYAESDTTGQANYYTGLYGSSDGAKAFAKTEFEASPLNRVIKQGAPGTAWQPNVTPSADHSVKFDYNTNSSQDTVRLWTVNSSGTPTSTATYPVNSLYKTTTWDENNNQSSTSASHTEEFKDMQGKVVLKRSYNGTEKLSTYYVYDDFDLLRVVIPPLAGGDGGSISSDVLSELCYQYRYDERKRMIMKKIPGAESILMVYDARDRLVLSQDGNARSAGKWMFTKYDCLNRPVITGYFAPGLSEEQLRTAFKNFTGTMYETAEGSGSIGYSFDNSYPSGLTIGINDILSVTYYDNYSHLGVSGFSAVTYLDEYDIDTYSDNTGNSHYLDTIRGQITGTKLKVLDTYEFTGSAKWLYSTNYYDDRYRVIQSRRTLYDGSTGGAETLANRYFFTGNIEKSKQVQTFNQIPTTVDKYFSYDTQGRLTKTEQEIAGDSNGRVTVAENVYNETGQLINKKLHKVGSNYLQNVDYTYNIRGWLNSINNPDNLSGDLFGERLLYQAEESGLTGSMDVQFNGNISGMVWNSTQRDKQGYRFIYDGLNRLKRGDHKNYSGGWYDNDNWEEKMIEYDFNGNITNLQRTNGSGGDIANYAYSYNGNRLNYITNNGTAYSYDLNGNTTYDGLRGMTVKYNLLNLPNSIIRGSDSIAYIYSAAGEKLAKRLKDNITYQYYAGSMIYEDHRENNILSKPLKYILFEEGVVNKSSGAYTYEYHLKDHLGNTRVAFLPDGGSTTIAQVAEYYPFGENYSTLFNGAGTNNKYLYNGKEKQTDELNNTYLDWYDYGARFYDPVIGRFHTVDPSADKYYSISPYAYCTNNPMIYIDPTGMEFTDAAWEWVNKLIAQVNRQQESNNARIADKQAKLDAGGLSAKQEKRLDSQIGNLQSQNKSLEGVKGEIATMAASDQTYNVVESSSQNENGPIPGMGTEVAYTSFNYNSKNVDITISSGAGLGLFAHELLHGYQFETGQISLGPAGGRGYSFLLDKTNEVAGYARQGMFGSNEGVTGISTLPERYSGLPQGPINVHNYSFQGRKLSDMNPYELQRLSTIMKQAYRYNGKTFY